MPDCACVTSDPTKLVAIEANTADATLNTIIEHPFVMFWERSGGTTSEVRPPAMPSSYPEGVAFANLNSWHPGGSRAFTTASTWQKGTEVNRVHPPLAPDELVSAPRDR